MNLEHAYLSPQHSTSIGHPLFTNLQVLSVLFQGKSHYGKNVIVIMTLGLWKFPCSFCIFC